MQARSSREGLHKMPILTFLIFCLLSTVTLGNVEKVIFTAPEAASLPADASIDNLLLISLSPKHPSVRTFLNATFPTSERPKGTESWLFLEGLNPSQRYEIRVCWAATQPTAFWLYEHALLATFETPSLISSLTSYAYERHAILSDDQKQILTSRRQSAKSDTSSALFLQIYAAAEYFSLNETLMTKVPPVFVDIILDPYLLNVVPQSLVPTAGFIILIAVGAWYLSAWTTAWLQKMLSDSQSSAAIQVSEAKDKKVA